MNIDDLYGKKVISNKFGEGTVLHPADKSNLYIQYGNKLQKQGFPKGYPNYFRFTDADEDKFARILAKMSPLSSTKLMKTAYVDYRMNELSKRCTSHNLSGNSLEMVGWSDSAFIKFEGTTMSPEEILEVNHIVDEDGKIKYLLNFSRVGENIREDDPFFICKGYGSELYIYGRGIVSAFNADNLVKNSWIEQHSWMREKDKYVFVKECEILATELTNCPTLSSIYGQYAGDIYSSQKNRKSTIEELKKIHNQKSHMFLTELGYEVLTNIFREYAAKYGTYRYGTDY